MSADKVESLGEFLRRSKADLSKGGPAKARFIAKVMSQVRAIVAEAKGAVPEAAKAAEPEPSPTKPTRDPSRVIAIQAKPGIVFGPGGTVQMTQSESMRADEELGYNPDFGGTQQ